MKQTISVVLAAAGLVLAAVSPSAAQTAGRRIFVDLNAGAQAGSPAVESASTFPLFGEDAGVASRQEIGTHPMFDVRIGYMVGPQFAVAFAFTGFESSSTGAVAASIPSPVVTGRPASFTGTAEDMNRRDLGYHPQIAYILPVAEDFTATLAFGPSFVHVQQPTISVVPVAANSQNVAVVKGKETGTVIGFNVGADGSYAVSNMVGIGVFARYVDGKKDFETIDNVSIRGFQFGGGLKLRF
jgi:hypothetical protein